MTPPAAILFRPSDLPLLDGLAKAFGVSPAVRSSTFHVYSNDLAVELPPEDEVPAAEVEPGMRFAQYFTGQILPGLGLVGERFARLHARAGLQTGWHPNASLEQLAVAAKDAGGDVIELRARLAGGLYPERSGLELMEALRENDDASVLAAYVLEGGPMPPGPVAAFLCVLLLMMPRSIDLPAPALDRIAKLMKMAAKEEHAG